MTEEREPRLDAAASHARRGEGAAGPGDGQTRTALANAMVALKKEYYGRGPTGAKAYLADDYIFVVLEGGLTRNEETLLAAGREDLVRHYRLTFEETVRDTAISAVERITGRRVVDYHSQMLFTPPRAFEIFVLEPRPA